MNLPSLIDLRPIGASAWLFAPPGAGDMHQLQSLDELLAAEGSASMLADACFSGRAVAVLQLLDASGMSR